MDTVEDIYPLGSDPVLTPPSTSGNPQPHAEACPVCDGLPYKVAPEAIKGWLRLPPNKKFEVLFGVNPMRPEAAGRIVVHPASGRPEMYFAGDWTPPDHHLAWDWVQSSAAGCDTCDLVVKALQHASPGFWADVTPTTTYKRIWAQAVPGICVMATTTDTRQRFLTNRHQMFEIAAVSHPAPDMQNIGHIEPVSATNWEAGAIAKVAEWLSNCRQNHKTCTKSAEFMPTRLLDIGSGQVQTIRLVEDTHPKPYVALSYCWGPDPTACLQTLRDNIEYHRRAILLEALPTSLSQTVLFCRALGYKRLWIDALCIVQDSPDDWAVESSSMGRIYSHADLVIGNEVTDDCRKPLHTSHYFASQDTTKSFRYKFRDTVGSSSIAASWASALSTYLLSLASPLLGVATEATTSAEAGTSQAFRQRRTSFPVVVRASPFLQHEQLEGVVGPLSSRAWAFQESLLPRRLLTFTQFELIWRCYGVQECECGSHVRDRMDVPVDNATASEILKLVASVRDGAEPAVTSAMNIDRIWKEVVSIYSRRDITQPADRLIAVAGISEAFGKIMAAQGISTRYLAGLWEHNLVESLVWSSFMPATTTLDTNLVRKRLNAINGQPTLAGSTETAGKDILKALQIMLDSEPCKAGKISMTILVDKAIRARNPGWAEAKYFPSWSWASSRMPVVWANFSSVTEGGPTAFFPKMDVLHITTNVWAGDTRKRIVTGSLTVNGHLVPVRLRSMPMTAPPVYPQRTFPDSMNQGLGEFWVAFSSSLHQVRFGNDLVSAFAPDSPCLYGTMVADAYRSWGDDMHSLLQGLEHGPESASQQRPIRHSPGQLMVHMFPCRAGHADASLPVELCADAHCWCHFGWTESRDEPFWALEVGRCRIDLPRGNSAVSSVFLVLRPVSDEDAPDSYWRIGCGSFLGFGDETSYRDPFRSSERRTIIIK